MFGATPSHGFYFRHVNRVEMSHIEVQTQKADARPCICTDDVHRADFFAISAQIVPPAFNFTSESSDIRVRYSRASEDVTIS